jgi:3-oxoacyl-[acyl-carrier-protein] synthase I
MTVAITNAMLICSVGVGVPQAWASTRAGISRKAASGICDKHAEPVVMAFLPEDWFDECPVPIETTRVSARWHRLLFMLAEALRTQLPPAGAPAPFVILSVPIGDASQPNESAIVNTLSAMLALRLDFARTTILYGGRADGFRGLRMAIQLIKANPGATVIVGASDSCWDHRVLANLEKAGRLLTDTMFDGFTPGEGAACLTLSTVGHENTLCLVEAVGLALGPSHIDDEQPDKGETLSNAVEDLRAQFSPTKSALTVFAGFNGEQLWAKEWGVAALRHRDIIDVDPTLEHPSDGYGDLGSATVPALVAMAALALANENRESPAMVFASSDGPDSGCAWLST